MHPYAELVYSGNTVMIPLAMGTPASDQMQGMPLEQLSELCCRVCYDSLGRGRSSQALHEHILEVKHLSVYRHATFTVTFEATQLETRHGVALACLNRKGVWVERGPNSVDVTINLQAVIEWDRYHSPFPHHEGYVGDVLKFYAYALAPQIVQPPGCRPPQGTKLKTRDLSDDQAYISIFMSGSRGFSHEQVRHNYAVSQRSTRYVDESESPWVEHPLIAAYANAGDPTVSLGDEPTELIAQSRRLYTRVVNRLEKWLLNNGVDKLTARKQARGAARGYLGNALQTELIFTSSVSGWKDMIRQRLNPAADAEIRAVYEDVLCALKSSCHVHRFDDMIVNPSPDGLGVVLA